MCVVEWVHKSDLFDGTLILRRFFQAVILCCWLLHFCQIRFRFDKFTAGTQSRLQNSIGKINFITSNYTIYVENHD